MAYPQPSAANNRCESCPARDVAYAESRREVTPTEQHIHGLLEQVPVMATALLIALHWDQARSLFGQSSEKPRFGLEPKRRPLSPRTRARLLTAAAVFGAAPYTEEIVRCYRSETQLNRP